MRRPILLVPALILLAVVLAAVAAGVLAPYAPDFVDLRATLTGPGGAHPLGGDGSGRDVLSRLLYGTRATLVGAVLATTVALAVGVVAGLLAGYFARWVDAVASWVFNLVLALPAIIVVLAYVAVAGPGLAGTMTLVGLLASPSMYRLVRTATQRVRGEFYIDAARVSGLSDLRIVRRHVLPGIRSTIIVQAPLLFGAAILIQAGIDFLGLGEPGAASWGSMLNDASANVYRAPWLSIWPGAAIAITVLAVTLLGNAVRDLLEDSPGRVPAVRRAGRPEDAAECSDALLSVAGLTVEYGGKPVVDGLSLEVRRGEVVGLVGESGSGKTQTVLAALGLLPPTGELSAGSVRFDGTSLVGLPERELNRIRGRRIGYVSQEPMSNLDPCFRVGGQLAEPLRVHLGLSRRAARRRALDLLAQVGITDPARVYRAYPHEISGGMAQRVLIAAAVSCDPDLLIADEPTTALDATVQAEVLDLLRSLQRERHLAVLLVTHDLGVVADMCDRVAVMRAGRLVETAATTALFARPAEPYTRMLLAANPHNAAPREPSGEPRPPLLEVEGLRVRYRRHPVLQGVDLTIGEGETLGLVGESGSGKTTLGRAILGLAPVSAGTIRYGGQPPADRRTRARQIQAIFQDPFGSLNPAMSIRDILIEPLLAHGGHTRAAAGERISWLLDQVALPAGTAGRRARELSGGQRQRVAIARALALRPRLIICDEPVSALDVSTQAQVLDLLVEIQRDTGVAYLFISHDLAVVRHVSDRVAVMSRGRLVETGDTARVTTEPTDPYTRRLLLSALVPDPVEQAVRRAARLAEGNA
ncbi:dipeptide ABC transporter ATP-binding protein [Nonomuraea angiospora]|uniref:dipeptide ABC transporter ATP-binding protein n=1 Tax=Nonomuraea angiospora TaxID=46172 RepID=UPI0029B3F3AE|nr:dipeptide ABC transporter ATP-binding protein [Nonomuraea angiospora]MDX3108663.1 dipeptide ABC transporter ATP-binding protein [Nonomuraea angiospora]